MSSEVRFEMRALEVGLPAGGEVADVVAAAGEVQVRGARLSRGQVDRGGCQGHQL